MRDQAGLQKLHDNLQQDYETLLKERDAQKDVEKKLRVDLRKLQSMSLSLSEDQDAILHAKQAIDAERESLRADARTLANLRSEHARLKVTHSLAQQLATYYILYIRIILQLFELRTTSAHCSRLMSA